MVSKVLTRRPARLHSRPPHRDHSERSPAKVEETPGFQRATTAAVMDPPSPLEWRATQAFYPVTPPHAGLALDKLDRPSWFCPRL
jgi:hypothetical protein